ncbi:TonB-dependent receptor [Methylobacillus arboreus]|uniref:TonB-dependent receptor n=1 Tax=Methylobacillus arboreus TaxID=755170 RepID=UPI001E41A888|nr:TonB-dependent receptor [Methylobacillus arboreus]MCB5190141.1 TonB-dependent receptor [Methylobacillus arboreus]
MKHVIYRIFLFLLGWACFLTNVHAREALTTLDETHVQASRDGPDFKNLPHSVSVITAEDIARSTASSVSDLLSREAGLNLMSFYGSDKKASIDIRGMGDTAVSNVLILVDGVKLNEFDLSGADLTTIAISQIERVEILRGGGSVEYGDGAVGGVINIITKRGYAGQKASASFEATRGSYDMEDLRANFRGSAGPFAATVNLSQLDTEGYRKNSDLRSRNGSVELRFMPNEVLDMYVRVASHRDEHGFPGYVSPELFRTERGRRSTPSPLDRGWTDDDTYTFGLNLDLERYGKFIFQMSKRDRVNDYVMSPNSAILIKEQLDSIQSERKDYSLRYDIAFKLLGGTHSLSMGANRQLGNYARYSGSQAAGAHAERKMGDLDRRGIFIKDTIALPANLTLTAGARVESFRTNMSDEQYSQDCQWIYIPIPGIWVRGPCSPYAYRANNSQGGTWRNHGSEIGLNWKPVGSLDIFGSVTRHFRSPNIDELVLALPELRPQTGKTAEIGVRLNPVKALSISGTLFKMKNEDEIYYGPDSVLGPVNRNYEEPTLRKGAELEGSWQATDNLRLRLNAGYVQPKFVGSGADVPHVPRKTANLNVHWSPVTNLSWTFVARYVGSRFDGNDIDNTEVYPKLPAYAVYDTSLRYDFGKWDLTAGVNNIFDKAYATMGYNATYYPMPGRNGFVRVRLHF